jgi:serine phosphatase RsbU (regulator of sigma subunit)
MNKFYILVAFGFFLNVSVSFSQKREVIAIGENTKYKVVAKENLSIFEDKSSFLSIKKVLEEKEKFLPAISDKPNFGYTKSAFFAKFDVINDSHKSQEVWVEVDYPSLDSVSFFVIKKNRVIKTFHSGCRMPFSQREVEAKSFVFKTLLAPYEQQTLVIRVRSERNTTFPIAVYRPDQYAKVSNSNVIGMGLYYGIMVAMLLYNLFVYSVLREKSYLYYLFFLFSMLGFSLSYYGQGFQHIWPNLPAFNRFNIPFFIASLSLSALAFGREFLNTPKRMPVANRVLEVLMAISSAILLLSLVLPSKASTISAVFMGLPSISTLVYVAVVSLRRGFMPAKYFTLAWSVFLLGALLTALRSLGALPHNFFTVYSIQIGSAVEVILLSLALADRITTLRKEVAERALEKERIEKQKEIEQKEFIEKQNERLELLVAERTHELYERNKHITDSIQYAQRIQKAILPSKQQIVRSFPESFIYFKPRDIVSGDFYWFAEKDNKTIVAVVDCTGHGVPGAFMSMIGNTLLNQIVLERGVTRPAEILNQLHEEVRFALKQDEMETESGKDGMDISICVFHQLHHILEFAGANNSMYFVKNGELKEYKGDRMGIGGTRKTTNERFSNQIIKLGEEDVTIYMASDGFADQFGGQDGSKFMARNLKKLLLELSSIKSLKAQHLQINKAMEEWRGEEKQIDDQLIVGFRISANASRGEAEITTKDIAQRKSEKPFKFTR